MNQVAFVTEEAAQRAREMEQRFRDLPPSAGILFVGVKALPTKGDLDAQKFELVVGVTRQLEEATGRALIKKMLENEMGLGDADVIDASVFRGVSGAARDEDSEDPHPAQA